MLRCWLGVVVDRLRGRLGFANSASSSCSSAAMPIFSTYTAIVTPVFHKSALVSRAYQASGGTVWSEDCSVFQVHSALGDGT